MLLVETGGVRTAQRQLIAVHRENLLTTLESVRG